MNKILIPFLLFSLNLTYALEKEALSLEEIEFSKEMTNKALDFHALLDDLENGRTENSALINTATELIEQPEDKNLAQMVVIVNRAPKGTAPDAQRAKVYIDGRLEKTFIVSTGKIGHESRLGYYRPVYTNHLRFYHEYYSGKYGSRMARAIFYSGGYAIHHTDAVRNLGSRASHGCVRFRLEDIDWINKTARELGNQNYELRKFKHAHHPDWKQNIFYRGLERADVTPLDSLTGQFKKSGPVKSIDMVILVKDERA